MAQGVKYCISDISDALIECDGIITAAAKKLGMARSALSERISLEPDLQPLLKDLRTNYEQKRLDLAENIYDKFINQWEKYPKLALQSASYILDNHGESRGYGKTKSQQDKTNITTADLANFMKDLVDKGIITQKDNDPIE